MTRLLKLGELNRRNIIVVFALLITISALVLSRYLSPKNITPLTQSWEKVIPHQDIPKGLVSLSAKDCGVCHQEYYKEWKTSTHAHAWTDLQFQAELRKESSPFLCINCHIPLQNQQEFIVSGLENGDIYKPVKKPNPHFDKDLQMEGITCASCHVRDGYIIGKTGSELAPHPVKVDSIHLSEQLCISCHNANAVVTPTLACTFETGDEWKAGPYFGKQNCISCHMPEMHRPIMPGLPEKKSHYHAFPGSGIPKLVSLKSESLDGMDVKVEAPKKQVILGDSLSLSVTVVNARAGHRLPSGDPERFYLINMKFYSPAGDLVHQTQNRIGERWQWYPEAKKLSDNNLNIGESRRYKTALQPAQTGTYTLKVEVTKHRMDEETAKYNKLGDEYPLFIYVYEEEIKISVEE